MSQQTELPAEEIRRKVSEHFANDRSRWVEEYRRAGYNSRRYQLRARAAMEMLASIGPHGGRLLEAGTGAGLQALEAHDAGWSVVATDLTPEMIETARSAGTGPRWLVASADELPFVADGFDAALMLGVIGYLPDAARALEALRRCIRPDGHLVISFHNRRTLFALMSAATTWVPRRLLLAARRQRSVSTREPGFYTQHNLDWRPREFEKLLADAGFVVVSGAAFDYGRIRPFGLKVFGADRVDTLASSLSEFLATLPGLRWLSDLAFTHVVLARRT